MTDAAAKAQLGAKVASYSAWNLVAYLVGIAANLLTMPFVLMKLGADTFGIAALVQATIAPFTLIAATIGTATARQVAAASASDTPGARLEFGASAAIALIAAAIGAVAIVVIGPVVARRFFTISEGDLALLPSAYAVAALGWAATVGTAVLQALYIATRDYRRIAHVGALSALVTAAAIFWFVSRAPTVISYLGALAAGFGFVMLAWGVIAIAEKRELLAFPRWDPRRFRALGSFGGWQIAAQVSGIAATQADRYLLGAFTRPADVAYYSVAQRLEEVAYIGVAKAGEVLFPVFSAEADSSRERQADLYFRAAWMLNLLAACMLGPLLPLSEDILRIWTDAATAREAQSVLFILTLGGLLGCGVNALAYFTMGLARTHLNFILAVITATISCTASAILLPRYGLAAAGVGTLLAMVAQLVAGIIISEQLFGNGRMNRQMFSIIGPLAIAIAVGCGLRFAAVLPHPAGWPGLIGLSVAVAVTIAAATMATTYLSAAGAASRRDIVGIATRYLPARLRRLAR